MSPENVSLVERARASLRMARRRFLRRELESKRRTYIANRSNLRRNEIIAQADTVEAPRTRKFDTALPFSLSFIDIMENLSADTTRQDAAESCIDDWADEEGFWKEEEEEGADAGAVEDDEDEFREMNEDNEDAEKDGDEGIAE